MDATGERRRSCSDAPLRAPYTLCNGAHTLLPTAYRPMSIATYIQKDVLLPRLRQTGVLVVYDPARRYRELCAGLAADDLRVVDATESGIESREAALGGLGALTQPNTKLTGLLIYVPANPPVTDEDRQRDPFSIYGTCGGSFPAGPRWRRTPG